MANEIVIKVKLDQDGSFKLVEQQAQKAAKATDNLGKSRNRYNKGEKGVAGATANSTKAFSKMRDSMTGSTGLVSAYAVLASNVFAATAAFNAFSRAAQVEQLEKGLIAVGAAAGQNLPDVAKGLRNITGEALSAEQAMRATALASASGFRSDQLNNLAKVAKGASLALGRDMADALDRLVRGTAKVEPEILDELGIFVRLDEAVREYANRLGVAESSLTQYERSQAFLNATIEQGLKKYEDLSKQIDPNPYDKLSASLQDLQKNVLGFVNGFLGLGDMVSFASRNLLSLTAVATTLGGAVTSSVAPGLLRMADASRENAEASFDAHTATAKQLTTASKLPKKFTALIDKLEDGTATTAEYKEANLSLVRSYAGVSGQITRQENEISKTGVATEAQTKSLAKLREQQDEYGNRLKQLKDIQASAANASIESSRASAIQNAANLNLFASFKDLGQAHTEDIERTTEANKGKKGLGKTIKGLGPAARTAAGGVKVLGTAFFTALPYIGLIVSGLSILYGVIKEKFFPEDLAKKRIDEAVESFKNFDEVAKSFAQNMSTGGERLGESYIALAGILDQIQGKIVDVAAANSAEAIEAVIDETNEREKQRDLLRQNQQVIDNINAAQVKSVALLQQRDDFMKKAVQNQDEIERLTIAIGNAEERKNTAEMEAAKQILAGAVLNLGIQMDINKATKANAFNTALTANTYQKLVKLQADLNAGTINFQEALVQLELIRRYPNEIRNSFQNLNNSVAEFNGIMAKRQQKAKVLFDQEEESAQGIIDKFEALDKASKERVAGVSSMSAAAIIATGNVGGFTEQALEAQAALAELETNLEGLRIPDEFKKDGIDGLRRFVEQLQDSRDAINALTVSLSQQKSALKALESNIKGVAGTQVILGEERNAMLETERQLIAAQIQAERDLFVASDPTLSAEAKQAEFEAQDHIVKLRAQEVSRAEKVVNIKVAEKEAALDALKVQEQQNRLSAERVKNDLRILKLQHQISGGRTTAAEQYEQEVTAAKATLAAAEAELTVTTMRLEIEYEILRLKFMEDEVISDAEQKVLNLLKEQQKVVKATAQEKVRGARLGVVEASVGTSRPSERPGGLAGSIISGSESIDAARLRASQLSVQAEEVSGEGDTLRQMRDMGQMMTQEQTARLGEIEAIENAAVEANRSIFNAQVGAVMGIISTMNESLAALGPEGAYAASFGEMANTVLASTLMLRDVFAEVFGEDMPTSMSEFSDKFEALDFQGKAQVLSAVFSAVASSVSALGNTMAAASRNAVAGVDKEIEAEKKRDGKSKASLAKIKQLEAKKEAMKKKAFEQDKKIKLASAILNTAAGVTQALASLPPPFSFVVAALTAAMGLKQVQLIQGMTYNGGGEQPGGGQPTSIAMGERRKSVDLAKSQSARGELAYFRGAQGTGGPENFRSAFTGYRNRAEGGNTAFMVGEQGPELFVPEVPGTIVPNDDVQAGAPTNVNFNISAVDAAGVEDLLIRQQGNIIGMIREAANSYGQDFVETVDTSVFNDTTGGVSRY